MASLNLLSKKFTYSAADERLISNARNLFAAVAEYDADQQARTDAKTASNAAQHVLEHITRQRNGKPAETTKTS